MQKSGKQNMNYWFPVQLLQKVHVLFFFTFDLHLRTFGLERQRLDNADYSV
jgi:hypothetical protein